MSQIKNFIILLAFFWNFSLLNSQEILKENHIILEKTDSTHLPQLKNDSITDVIYNFHLGFEKKYYNSVRKSIGEYLSMFNGNFSDDPSKWQAHLFLHDAQIDDWIAMMIEIAGPFNNKIVVTNIHIRQNAALVTTRETGQNKFRKWDNEEILYIMGKMNDEWKIVGFFIKNLKNPD